MDELSATRSAYLYRRLTVLHPNISAAARFNRISEAVAVQSSYLRMSGKSVWEASIISQHLFFNCRNRTGYSIRFTSRAVKGFPTPHDLRHDVISMTSFLLSARR